MEDGRAVDEPPSRLAVYIDFQMVMADVAPAIFLYSGHYIYAVSQRVHGVHMNKAIESSDRSQYWPDGNVNTTEKDQTNDNPDPFRQAHVPTGAQGPVGT